MARFFIVIVLSISFLLTGQGNSDGVQDLLSPSQRHWLNTHQDKLILLEYHDNPPIEFRNSKGMLDGISADYIHLIEKNLGFSFQTVRAEDLSTQETLELLKSHVVTKCNLQKTPARMNYFLFTEPYLELPHAIIVREGTKGSLEFAGMEKMKISVVQGYAIHELLNQSHPQLNFDVVTDHVEGLKHVAFQISDAMIINFATASYYFENEGLTNLRVAGTVGILNKLSLASGRNYPEFHEILKIGLASITDEQRKKIYNRWITLDRNTFISSTKFWSTITFITLFVLFITATVFYINSILKKQVKQKTRDLQAELATRKQMEKKLVQAQKMEAIGTFANGIAHDFNNVLGTIIGYGEMMEMYDVGPEDVGSKRLEQILQAAYRGQDLVNQILTFSRQPEQKLSPVHLQTLIREVLSSIQITLPKGVTISHDLGKGKDTVLGNSTQLHQVLMNLCVNAVYAMKDNGGTLTVTLKKVNSFSKSDKDISDSISKKHFRISISDTGTGMSDAVIERIFEPFYTTKESGEGTGMGLAISHGIVKSFHGSIDVVSSPGNGTTFSVYLPAHDVVLNPTQRTQKKMSDNRSGRLLIIDDDERFLAYLCETLDQLGFQVTAENDSVKAWYRLCKDFSYFDAIVTDQDMPHLSGVELIEKLHRVNDKLPIILCTGMPSQVSASWLNEFGVTLLRKPATPSDIFCIMDDVLGVREQTSQEA